MSQSMMFAKMELLPHMRCLFMLFTLLFQLIWTIFFLERREAWNEKVNAVS